MSDDMSGSVSSIIALRQGILEQKQEIAKLQAEVDAAEEMLFNMVNTMIGAGPAAPTEVERVIKR